MTETSVVARTSSCIVGSRPCRACSPVRWPRQRCCRLIWDSRRRRDDLVPTGGPVYGVGSSQLPCHRGIRNSCRQAQVVDGGRRHGDATTEQSTSVVDTGCDGGWYAPVRAPVGMAGRRWPVTFRSITSAKGVDLFPQFEPVPTGIKERESVAGQENSCQPTISRRRLR